MFDAFNVKQMAGKRKESAAEKQRRYRERRNADEQRRVEYLLKETKKLLRHFVVSREVTRTLAFHHAVMQSIREKYKECKTNSDKRKVSLIFVSRAIRKYRMQRHCLDSFGITCRPNNYSAARTKHHVRPYGSIRLIVKQFYIRDDISRTTAGKKETITKGKERSKRDSYLTL